MDKPSFFKVIVSPTLQLRQLMFPRRFVKKYGSFFLPDSTAEKMYLRVQDSATRWPVELVKKKKKHGDGDGDDVVLLGKGWPEFSKHYMISLGYFLVFRYEGRHSNCFHVIIFDISAAEINYTRVPPPPLSQSQSPTNDGDDFLVPDSSKKKVKRTTSSCSYSPGKRKISADINGGGGFKGIVKHREDGAMKRALTFKSNNPHFLLYMCPSYVAPRCNTHIPRCYSKLFRTSPTDDNSNSRANTTINLCLQQPTTDHVISWPVKYRFKDSRVSLSTGWIRFVLDNNIRVGDVCVFELIDPTTRLYKVSICRAT